MKITKDGGGKYKVDLADTKITVYDTEVAGFNFVQHLFNPNMVSKVRNGQWDFEDEKRKTIRLSDELKSYVRGIIIGLNFRKNRLNFLNLFLAGYTFGVISSVIVVVLFSR